MSNVLIKDGDFVIAFDSAKITKVTSTSNNKVIIYGVDGDSWLIDAVEHPNALAQAVKVLSEHFEIIDIWEEETPYAVSPDVIYRLEKTGIATWFKLIFPSQSEYDFAGELLATETRFKFRPWDSELYAMSLTFAPFYDNFTDNYNHLVDILGEPQA